MAPGICRSIANRFPTIVFCLISMCAAPLVLAQHPGGHIAGGAHVSASPIYHAPAFHAPISAPRVSTFRSSGGIGAGGFGAGRFFPRRPIHPFPPVIVLYDFSFAFGSPFWGFNCWWGSCDLFWPGMFEYNSISSPSPANYVAQVEEPPNFYGSESDYGMEQEDTPQLYLKDGTTLNVNDYWLVDDQLHFTIIEQYGAKPAEKIIPFAALDLQKTVDVNTQRGFRFVLRNEPLDQYVRDHPEGPPPVLTPQP